MLNSLWSCIYCHRCCCSFVISQIVWIVHFNLFVTIDNNLQMHFICLFRTLYGHCLLPRGNPQFGVRRSFGTSMVAWRPDLIAATRLHQLKPYSSTLYASKYLVGTAQQQRWAQMQIAPWLLHSKFVVFCKAIFWLRTCLGVVIVAVCDFELHRTFK